MKEILLHDMRFNPHKFYIVQASVNTQKTEIPVWLKWTFGGNHIVPFWMTAITKSHKNVYNGSTVQETCNEN